MIVQFNLVWLEPCGVMAMAVMYDAPPIQVGIFEDVLDAEEACEQFQVDHDKSLH